MKIKKGLPIEPASPHSSRRMVCPIKSRHHCCDRHPTGIQDPHVSGPRLSLLAHLTSHPSMTWVHLLPYYKSAAEQPN